MNNKYLFPIYIILVFLFSVNFESKIYQISYLAFALLVGFLFFKFHKEEQEIKLSKWLIIIPVIIILVSRTIPFIGFEAPLGYDTGLYKHSIEFFAKALPNLPEFTLEVWAVNEPLGLYLITNLLSLIGFNTNQILYFFYILVNLFLGLGIYILVKRFFNSNAALCALFLFAVSVTQFQAYWFLYYKQLVALFLMLMAFWLLKKNSWLAIPVAGFLGGLHPMTFFLFGLVLLANFIFNKNKEYHLISGLSILTITFSLYLHNPWVIFNLFPTIAAPLGTIEGRFFDFCVYTQLAAFYLPFAILGFIYLIREKKFNYLFFWFLFNFLIVYFGFFFHNRFIIPLDIIVIILAGIIVSQILSRIPKTIYNKCAILIFSLGMVYFLINNVISTKALISQEELNEIKSLNFIAEENAYMMSTISHYSPWLYGYSNRKVIAPGMFEYDTKWTEEEWYTFWQTEDHDVHHQLLDRYEGPLYIFVGDIDPYQLKLKFEKDSALVKISERVYKYGNNKQ